MHNIAMILTIYIKMWAVFLYFLDIYKISQEGFTTTTSLLLERVIRYLKDRAGEEIFHCISL